jgi:DNA repair/transcription protein MET18/MMS19
LIGVIESLREYINDEEPAVRAKAVTYLAHLIEALPTKFLSRQQIQVLCQFLCDRIDDDGATMGLERLVCLPRFHVELAVTTFRA